MLKCNELSSRTSCLNKADAMEPIFVLRAKDPYASMAVRHWATMATGRHESEKIEEALRWADEMDAWRDAQPVTGEIKQQVVTIKR